MAKGKTQKPRRGGPEAPKKGLVAKKAQIDKLVEQSKSNASSTSTSRRPTKGQCHQRTSPPSNFPSHPRPLPVKPGSPEPEIDKYLICDQRSHDRPEIPLIRLPDESSVKYSRFVRQGQFPFLRLPGELRNKIYEYAIERKHYAIRWVSGNHTSKTLTYYHANERSLRPNLAANTPQRRRDLDFYHRRAINQHLPQDSIRPGPTTLLYVSKQLSEEAASVFYSKSFFYFTGLGTLRHFLDYLRKASRKALQSLSVTYRAYGPPLKIENQPFKERHDRLWEEMCWRITDECSLTHLELKLVLHQNPMHFAPFDVVEEADPGLPENASTKWIRPLFAFQDAGIQRCWVKIYSRGQESAVLEVESWKIRKEILGEYWDEEAEAERGAYGYEKKKDSKAQKGLVLRLRVDGGCESG